MSIVAELEQNRATNEELVALRDMALRLSENPDFRRLFVEGYFRDEAARLVQLSEDPILDATKQNDCLRMAQATGHCKRYLSAIVVRGNVAANDIMALDEQIAEARQEEAAAEAERYTKSGEATGNDGSI